MDACQFKYLLSPGSFLFVPWIVTHFAIASCERGGFKLSLIIKTMVIQMSPLNRPVVSMQVIIKPVAKCHGTLLIWGGRINFDFCFVLEPYRFKLQTCLGFWCVSVVNSPFFFLLLGAETTIYFFKWAYSWTSDSCAMDKIGIRTSCHHNQYNGMHLEIKRWSSGKKCDECNSNIERLMRIITSIGHFL